MLPAWLIHQLELDVPLHLYLKSTSIHWWESPLRILAAYLHCLRTSVQRSNFCFQMRSRENTGTFWLLFGLLFRSIPQLHWKLILHNLMGHCPLLNDGFLAYIPILVEMVFPSVSSQTYGLFYLIVCNPVLCSQWWLVPKKLHARAKSDILGPLMRLLVSFTAKGPQLAQLWAMRRGN